MRYKGKLPGPFAASHRVCDKEYINSLFYTILECHVQPLNLFLLQFLGAFAKFRKRLTASSSLSLCLSVRPHSTIWLPMKGFSWNFVWVFFENLSRNFKFFIKIWQEQGVLYMQAIIYFWTHFAQFFLEWKIIQIKVVEEIKTYIMFYNFFFLVAPFMR